jgi:DNA-binding phage protein
MAKTKTSDARAIFLTETPRKLRPGANVREHDPSIALSDPKLIRAAILESLDDGDYEDVLDIYRSHLRVLNRTHAAKAMGVSRQYIHKMLKAPNKLSLKTFVAFMKALKEATVGANSSGT